MKRKLILSCLLAGVSVAVSAAVKSGDTVAFVGGLPHDLVVRSLGDAGVAIKPVVIERLDQGVLTQKLDWVIMTAGADSKNLPAAAADRLKADGTKVVRLGSANPDGAAVANEIVKTLAQSVDDTGRPVFVIDRIANLGAYQRLNPNFAAAFKFIREKGWETMKPQDGKFYIDGQKVYAFVNDAQLKPWSKKLVEAHYKYIDIQVPLDGNEVFGVGRLDPQAPKHPTCADGEDICFRVQDLFPVTVHPGEFALFFPPLGAHAPCCSDGQSKRVKKLVVKVRTN